MNELYEDIRAWKIRVTQRNVARGWQSSADLDDVKAHGHVTSPEPSLCRTLAVEAAKDIDSRYKDRRS